MSPFTRYDLNETENGMEIVLYIDENLTEFASELGTVSKDGETNLEKEAVGFVRKMFPKLKVKSVKVMAGAMLLTSFGMGAIPTIQASAAEATTVQTQHASTSYIVSAGDTLYSIANKNGTTVDAIKQANSLSSNVLNIGQKLVIPASIGTLPSQTYTTSYTVVSGDTLYDIAKQNGTTVDAIKQANNLTTNTLSIGQTLTIPSGKASTSVQTSTYTVVAGDTLFNIATQHGTTVDAIKQVNSLTSNTLNVGQTLKIPRGYTTAPAQVQTTAYTVVSGDTLYSIATQHGTTVDAIKQVNGLASNTLNIGQTLKIPGGYTNAPTQAHSMSYSVVTGDTLYSIATQHGTTVDAIKQANNLTSNNLSIGQTLKIPSGNISTPDQGQTTSHTVVSGDTLFLIAKQYGTTVDAIKQVNGLSTDVLDIGQTLTIPSSNTVVPPTNQSVTTKQESTVNQEDVEWLAKMIYSEGRGESLEGQIAIGAVIMNRVNSPLFPNSVKEVLFEKSYGYYQFTPAETGAIHTAEPNAQNYEAAERALNGEDPTNGALFFYNPDKAQSAYLESRTVSTTIGNHVFTF